MTAVTTDDLPADVAALIDREQYVQVADFPVERAYIWQSRPGGDILCEVTVFGGESRFDAGEKASAVIEKEPR